MSQTVDNRVVELEFDNKQFEQGTKESLNTLQKLKEALKFKDAGENLKGLSDVTKNFDFSSIGDAVERVGDKFSTLRMVGLMALSNLVNGAMEAGKKILSFLSAPLEQIKTGGWARAMNIEEAKFQLEGLKVAWDDIKDDIDYGVKDTAYGLDAAARAASQLVASNVQVGDSMKAALRGISGVAAMTNSSYEDISQVFTRVAGQGRVMATDLNSLSARGLNAAATLGEALGKSEAEIRKMVSKGQIDFATFSKAMDDAFGQHAKDANKTFNGALSNIKAALSRIGAEFATPFIHTAIPVLNLFREAVNNLKNSMGPLYTEAASGMEFLAKIISSKIEKLKSYFSSSSLPKIFTNIAEIIKNAFWDLMLIIEPIKEAFRELFPKKSLTSLWQFTENIKSLTRNLIISEESAQNIKDGFKGLFSIFDIGKTAILKIIDALTPYKTTFKDVGDQLLKSFGNIGRFITDVSDSFKHGTSVFDDVLNVIGKIRDAFSEIFPIKSINIVDTISKAIDFLNDHLSISSETIDKVYRIAKGFFALLDIGKTAIGNILQRISPATSIISPIVSYILELAAKIGDLIVKIRDVYKETGSFSGVLKNLPGIIQSVVGSVKNSLSSIFKNINFDSLAGGVSSILSTTVELLGIFISVIASAFSKLPSLISNVITLIGKGVSAIGDGINNFFSSEGFDNVKDIAFGSLIPVIIYNIKRLVDTTTDFIKAIHNGINPIANITTFLDKVRFAITQWTKADALAKVLKSVAIAIGILSVSLFLLSKVDSESLFKATAAITALFTGLSIATKYLMGINTALDFGQMYMLSNMLIKIAAAMGILAISVRVMGSMSWEDVIKGLGSLALSMLMLTKFVNKFAASGVDGEITKASISLILIAMAMRILASAIKAMGNLPLENLIKGLIGLAGSLFIFAQFAQYMSKISSMSGDLIKIGASLILLSTGMVILSAAIAIMGHMSIDDLLTGLAGLAGSLLILGVAFDKIGDMNGVIKTAGAIAIVSVAILTLSAALKVMASISLDEMVTALIGLGGSLFLLGTAFDAIGDMNGVIKTAAAMAIMSAAVLTLSAALKIMSTMGVDGLLISITGLAAGLLLMGIAVETLQNNLKGAAVILVAGVAIGMLAASMLLLSMVPLEGLIKGLVGLMAVLLVISVAAEGFQAALLPMLSLFATLSASMILLGLGMAAVGASLIVFGLGLSGLAAGFMKLTEVPMLDLVATLGLLLVAILEISVAAVIFAAAFTPILAMAAGLAALSAALALLSGSLALFGMSLVTLTTGLTALGAVPFDTVINALVGFTATLVALGVASVVFMLVAKPLVTFIIVLAVSVIAISAAVALLGASLVVLAAGMDAIGLGLDGLKNVISGFVDAGKNILLGIKEGLEKGWEALSSFVKGIGEKILAILKDTLGIASPSTETAYQGQMLDEGLAKGITDNTDVVKEAVAGLGEDTLGSFDESFDLESLGTEQMEELAAGITSGSALPESALDDLTNSMLADYDLMGSGAEVFAERYSSSNLVAADSISRVTSQLAHGQITWSQWTNTAGTAVEKVRRNREELERLNKLYSEGKMSQEEYSHATQGLEREIEDLIGDVQTLKNMLAELNGITVKNQQEVDRLDSLYKKGQMTYEEYTHATSGLKKQIESANYLINDYCANIEDTNDAEKDGTKTNGEYAESIGKVGGSAKAAKDELQQFQDSIKSTLEGQMDVFSEFKQSEKHTKDELFKNIESQINGMAAWAVNMDKLSERGIDQGLYQKLAEMGPQGAGYMEAFLDMTDEELQKYNQLWATSLVLPDYVSKDLTNNMQKIGEGVGEGMAKGIDNSTGLVTEAAADQGHATIKESEGVYEINSPSHVYERIGQGLNEGLELGIRETTPLIINRMIRLCKEMIKITENQLDPSKFTAIASKLMGGLESGINESSSSIISKMGEIGRNISEGLANGIEAASASVSKAASKVASIAAKVTADKNEVKSPSRVMMRLGEFISEGLAIGIDNKSAMVVRTVEDMNDDVVNTMKLTIANIASQINDGMEDPVITPVLDLTRVESGMKSLSSMLTTNDMVAKASGSFDTLQNGQLNSSSGINFIQNNYSPKALSRTDIYRQTNNQLLMLKKVAYNG